ncbi:MAG: DNA repair protein RecN [Candidatus Cloacimonadales bacterium]
MLSSLLIENFIIVKRLNLNFSQGLQILSGETGAGKSILVGAIQLSLGGKVKAGMLFDETKPAVIETVFEVNQANAELQNLIEKYEIELDEQEIFFRKEISTNLRGKSFINGRRVSNSIIKEFYQVLLDFHGQRNQQQIFEVEYQLALLDKYGNLEELRAEFEQDYQLIKSKTAQLKQLRKNELAQHEKMELYKYQINEIAEFQLQKDEDDILQHELNFLNHAEEIIATSESIEQEFYEQENSVYDLINNYIFKLGVYEKDNQQVAKAVSLLRDSAANLEEAIEELRAVQDFVDLDKDRLKQVEERLDAINMLKMKYQKDVNDILLYAQKIAAEREAFSSYSEKISELATELQNALILLQAKGQKLSAKRQQAALKLEKELEQNIQKLAIPDAAFQIKFDKAINKSILDLEDFQSNGLDKIEFYFSANKGKAVQPLKDSASGGEISRFLLAVKKILAEKLTPRTVIFDEIDTGIGGKTAELLGEFIADISRFHQVICITHLAQIAAFADGHFFVYKKSDQDKTVVDIAFLERAQRKKEIARMLSGSESELALKYAGEIIKNKGRIEK